MPDLWIDDHVGDEARPSPEFAAALRSSIAAELGRRRTPWRALGWVAAAVALVGVIATVLVSTRDHHDTISPAPSGQALVDRVVGRTWYLVTDNGLPVASLEPGASFELRADGSYVGNDGCNSYGSIIDPGPPANGWSIDGTRLVIAGDADLTAVGCAFQPSMPLLGESDLSLSGDGTVLTITGDRTYVATTLPPLTEQALADRLVGVRWTVTSAGTEITPQVTWFELHPDGTLDGFNGCVDYHGDSWSLVGDQLTVGSVFMDQPLCAGQPDIVPLTGNTSRVAIDGLGRGLTVSNEQMYTALPPAPPDTTPDTVPTDTVAPFLQGDALGEAIAGKQWYVITADGATVQSSAWITLWSDRTFTGTDGCSDFVTDPGTADGWSLNGRILSVPPFEASADCVGIDTVTPELNGSALSLDGTGTRLTVSGQHTYLLSTEPARDRVEGKRWYVMVHGGQDATVNAWFELHPDGSFSGFDGCNDYASSTDPSSPPSGWKIEQATLRVFGEIGASTVGCSVDTLMPVVDGMTLNFEEGFNAIYMEGPAGQFTMVLSPVVDPAATTTTAPTSTLAPVGPVLTPEDRAGLLAAALLDRARVHNSFGGAPLPVAGVRVVDTVGQSGENGSLDLRSGTPLTAAERAAITAAFAPESVEFVPTSDIATPMSDGDRALLQVGTQVLVDGQLAVVSSITCGSSCATGGAITATKHADGAWVMGDPIGPQFIA